MNKIVRSFLKRKYKILSLIGNNADPSNPYAFVRAHNEIETIGLALKTMIGGGIKRGVIAYHLDENNSDDGTGDYIEQFCKENKDFIPLHYPYKIIDSSHKELYKQGPTAMPKELRLDTYYNFAFDKIPCNSWFIKIDCDHIHNEVALSALLKRAKRQLSCPFTSVYLTRMDMHYDNGELYIYKNRNYPNGYIDCADQLFIYKHKYTRFYMNYDKGNERLMYPNHTFFLKDENIASIHFPLLKKQRRHLATPDMLIPYDEYDFSQLNLTEIDKEFLLNKEKILSYFK